MKSNFRSKRNHKHTPHTEKRKGLSNLTYLGLIHKAAKLYTDKSKLVLEST